MRILVTGADGFVGRHLCPHLEACGDTAIQAAGRDADVTDPAAMRAAVEAARADGIIHLAGFASVGQSHKEPSRAFAINALGTVNLLAAVQQLAPQTRVLLIGSAEMYGPIPAGTRADESFPLRPTSPYASSKVAAEIAGFQVQRSAKVPVIAARSFNHLGRGQRSDFVAPAFAEQLAAIRRKAAPPVLHVGNLEPVRDFSHVEDVVAAYRLLLLRGEPGEAYNVCSGEGRSVRDLLDRMIALCGIDVSVETDPARLRPVEMPWLVGDAAKLRRLGWTPKRSLDDALRDALASAGAI